jgi:aldehyde:ferredoxin oxidoreductase
MERLNESSRILYVDLTTGMTRTEPISPKLREQFIGGWGINFKIASDLLKPHTDPFSPENPLIFGVGPLVGTSTPGSAKFGVTTKFALPAAPDGRNYVATAMSGSLRFSGMLRRAGFDHIVITGRADRPVYLRILDGGAEVCDAGHLWGKKDIYETADALTAQYGNCGTVAIGRAGENRCRFAMAVTDKQNTLGRAGLGAVMGSKNLKAVVCRSTREIVVANPARHQKLVESLRRQYRGKGKPRGDFSKTTWITVVTENMNPGVWSKYDWDARYGPKNWEGTRKSLACNSCWLACLDSMTVRDGEHVGTCSQTGTHLWVAVVGQKLGLTDHRASIKLMEKMNREGICAATASSLIDWVTRRYEQGVITVEDTGGVTLKRDLETYLNLLDIIIERKGFGDALSEGWFEASRWLGRDARADYVEGSGIAKGTDCIYPARAAKLDPMRFSMGVSNPRGGHSCLGASIAAVPLLPLALIKANAGRLGVPTDALERIFQPADYYGAFNLARLTKHLEDYNSATNCLGSCEMWSALQLVDASSLAELYSAVVGAELGPEELNRAGERAFNLYKVLNVREGFGRADDAFPEAWLHPLATPDGLHMLTDYYRMHVFTAADIHRLLDDYYEERGWDVEHGVPTREKLSDMGIDS